MLFVLNKGYDFGLRIIVFGWRFVGAILYFMDAILCLSHGINHFLEDFLLLSYLLFSVVTLTYQSVVLGLVFQVTVLDLVEHLFIALLKCLHVFY